MHLATHRPEPAVERCGAGARLERQGPLRGARVEEAETPAVLHERSVVHEARPVERGGRAGVVDEGVLEEPQVATASEVVDMLIVPAEDRSDTPCEERVQRWC